MNGLAENGEKESIYKKIKNSDIESILSALQGEVEKYLSSLLPPKSDYSLTISVRKGQDHAEFVIDIAVRGVSLYSKDLDKAVMDAINYSKRRFVELLYEEMRS